MAICYGQRQREFCGDWVGVVRFVLRPAEGSVEIAGEGGRRREGRRARQRERERQRNRETDTEREAVERSSREKRERMDGWIGREEDNLLFLPVRDILYTPLFVVGSHSSFRTENPS